MPKRPVKASASSTRAFGSSTFGSAVGASGFSSNASSLSYVWEPPNLTTVSDPNLVVAFKNLSKKDSTTKAKGLEEIQTYVKSSNHDVEDAVLESWVQFYPRLSIDSARRVRQLSHNVLGRISVACGKRFAKYMPQVVGAWLAGTFDNDRAVSKAAQDALRQLFPSNERIQGVKKAYQSPVLEFCKNAIDNETPLTLSDERIASPDDVEAKYNRLIASIILLITNLLQELSAEEIEKQAAVYSELLQDEALWKLAYHHDTQVRRAIHRLLRTCVARHKTIVEPAFPTIGTAYVGHGLRSDQTGTSLDFVEALNASVALDASVWTGHAKGAKGSTRLCSFLKRGSQLGPPDYWPNVVALLRQIPREAYFSNLDDAREVLSALAAGIRKKEEPRPNLPAAWRAYVHATELLLEGLTFEDTETLVKSNSLPVIQHYVKPSQETTGWELPDRAALAVVDQLLELESVRSAVLEIWPHMSEQLIQDMQTSLPEQSKDFHSSQDRVGLQGRRWASIHNTLIRFTESESDERSMLEQVGQNVVNSARELLTNRNGKPYGAATILVAALYTVQNLDTRETESFVQERLPGIFCAPSATHLADILYFFYDRTWFQIAWEHTLQTVLEHSPDYLSALLSSSFVPADFDLAASSPALRSYLDGRTQQALQGEADWTFLQGLSENRSKQLDDAIVNDALLARLTESLTLDDQAPRALDGLHALMKADRKAVEGYLQKPEASQLLPRLLFLSESADEEVANSALNLNSLVQNAFTQASGGASSLETLSKVIQAGLLEASETSVSVEALVKLAQDHVERQNSHLKPEDVIALLPEERTWDSALAPFLGLPPLPSLAITSSISGALALVQAVSTTRGAILKLPRDAEGHSVALRIMRYMASLLQKVHITMIPGSSRVAYARLFCLSLVLANDNLTVAGANHLWSQYSQEVESDMADLVSAMQATVRSWTNIKKSTTDPESSQDFAPELLQSLRNDSNGNAAASRCNAEAYATFLSSFVETNGPPIKEADFLAQHASELRKTGESVHLAALLHGHGSTLAPTSVGTRWPSELVAELTGHDFTLKINEGLQKLIVLNLLFANVPGAATSIAKQRTVFFMRSILKLLEPSQSAALKNEGYQALTHVLLNISDLYGEHWSQMLNAITDTLASAQQVDQAQPEQHGGLTVIYHALKLYAALKATASAEADESNDDLVDALKDAQQMVVGGLFNILTVSQDCPDEYNQPLQMINELVARQVGKMHAELYPKPEIVYPLLSTPSETVQQVAYTTLHKKIQGMQEKVSLDAALEKRSVKLPEELLSLILEAPTTQELEDAPWGRNIPLPLRGYLLSWLLVFDHFTHASYKVKSDYLDSLKEVSPLPPLLDFTFDFLGHRRGKPADSSKFDITTYDAADTTGDAKRDCQQLLSHIYFLALQHAPSLVKAWWIELRARALVSSIETWTEKHISPHIISTALGSVQQWATEQADPSNPNAAPDNERLKIAISQRANEIRASYDIDEQTLSITIKLPGSWPLTQATVLGTSRVGVSEAKWQSWVRGCQGVITFSNNNIIDGLVAFRRNVAGAMKGQTECAICYSVISSDKQLPSKRCGTCKNLFHSGCLYRWFKTSNASTCPLCRNPFNYG